MKNSKEISVNIPFVIPKIVIVSSKKSIVLALDKIEYLEAMQCYTNIYDITGNSYLSSRPLKYYTELLMDKNFLRVHNKYLININYVSEIESGVPYRVILNSGKVIPVTKFNKGELINLIMNH